MLGLKLSAGEGRMHRKEKEDYARDNPDID